MKIVDFDKLSEMYWDGNFMEIHKDDIPSIPSAFEGMTNGDVLKTLFPTFKAGEINSDTVILEQLYPLPTCVMQFNRKWWNSPYKSEEK